MHFLFLRFSFFFLFKAGDDFDFLLGATSSVLDSEAVG